MKFHELFWPVVCANMTYDLIKASNWEGLVVDIIVGVFCAWIFSRRWADA